MGCVSRYINVIINEIDLPMQKISTQLHFETGQDTMERAPRKSTVNFIKQFARVYSCSTVLPLGFGVMMAN